MKGAVTQADREWTADYIRDIMGAPYLARAIRKGLSDEHVEPVARHREAETERCARIAESVELPADYIWSEGNVDKFKFGAEVAAQSIRAHTGPSS